MILSRTAIGLGAAALTLAVTGTAASAVEITTATSTDGDALAVSGGDARPGTTVVVTGATGSGPEIDVASCEAPVGAGGTWSCDLTGLRPGAWTLNAAGTDADGHAETTPLRDLQVGAAGPPAEPPALATTGGSPDTPLAVAGAALLLLGAGVLHRVRRLRVPKPQQQTAEH
ncbi:LPXTG cell wall anchor domain-containing protein [Asanoa sp. NPDC049518]|uniref:LPXTG cell wall anchor domain-containing protein n=1 Tax=unclassified Asanoa TaxID=2685164 RepID=UPI003426D033